MNIDNRLIVGCIALFLVVSLASADIFINNVKIDSDGSVEIPANLSVDDNITNTYWKSIAPFLDENTANVANKPTLVARGLFQGYSMPEYAVGEELFFRMRIPHRWNNGTNPHFVAITSISAAEDVGDQYAFNLSWVSEDIEHVIPTNTIETVVDTVTVADGTEYYAEIIAFELDSATMVAGQNIQMRLRRVAPAGTSVDNEIVIWHWDTRWQLDKLGTNSTQGYDG